MNGIHDMGGMHGFGPVAVETDEPVFHAPWHRRVLGMVYQVVGFGWTNIDTFRHGIERIDPATYLTTGYYGRWLASLETVLAEAGVLAPGEVDARIDGRPAPPPSVPRPGLPQPSAGFVRAIVAPPAYAVGQAVRARTINPAGHTRLPRYVRGKRGIVHHVHPACVYPDTNAHGGGEQPCHLYSVRFAASELWGADAEPHAVVHVDLFEPYLEPV